MFFILFIFILSLPMLKSLVSPASRYSLRGQEAKPASSASGAHGPGPGFANAWNAYADEHFAGRDILIHCNNLLQVKLLHVSPIETVALGRDGWLFLAGSNLEMDYFRAAPPFAESELAQWRRVLLQRHIWLRQQGIPFLFVVAPNKSSIYPEYVPSRVRRGVTRLEQLLDYLRRRPLPADFHLVDLRQTLRAGKSRYPVFIRTDSHWNAFGAMLAANKVLRTLSRLVPFQPPAGEDFSVAREPGSGPGGDLAAMLSLAGALRESQAIHVVPRRSPRMRVATANHWLDAHLEIGATVCPGAELPEALMFRDSFGYALEGYLSEYFRKITYVRDMQLRFHPGIVRSVRPKIVIQEMAERFFQVLSPANDAELESIAVDR